MARVLGQGGVYLRQSARQKERTILILGCASVAALSWISGFLAASHFGKARVALSLLITVSGILAAAVIWFYFGHRLEKLAKQRDNLWQGEAGEVRMARKLAELPDTFFVIHGLSNGSGDIDHIVIGPTGVFAIDTKTWKGTVTADGKGELLINGCATEKHAIKSFVSRVMVVKDTIQIDRYIKAVFVFTSARVDANWGTTGAVHCIREDQLRDYILNNKPLGGTLSRTETKTFARAFKSLTDPNENSSAPQSL
jgi:hypothetical protein